MPFRCDLGHPGQSRLAIGFDRGRPATWLIETAGLDDGETGNGLSDRNDRCAAIPAEMSADRLPAFADVLENGCFASLPIGLIRNDANDREGAPRLPLAIAAMADGDHERVAVKAIAYPAAQTAPLMGLDWRDVPLHGHDSAITTDLGSR